MTDQELFDIEKRVHEATAYSGGYESSDWRVFAGHALDDLPKLIAEVRRLRARLDDLEFAGLERGE